MTNPPKNQTEMSNPPKNQTELSSEKKPATVKVRIMRDVMIPSTKQIVAPRKDGVNVDVEVSEEDAKELCDVRFKTHYAHTGESYDENPKRHSIRRAIRVEEIEAAEKLRKMTG